jgi:hypothetical protein
MRCVYKLQKPSRWLLGCQYRQLAQAFGESGSL